MRPRLVVGALVACGLAAGCGPSPPALDASGLGLPVSGNPTALASTTIYTSPDGGIYRNPDAVEVLLAARHSADVVAADLGAAASSWAALQQFGAFTMVALRLRDNGQVSSDPQLNDLQVASDYAPPGTSSGPLRHFYHPMYPLALVAPTEPGDGCSVHLDPGHTEVVVLVYPPAEIARSMVWGAYGDFALTVPTGGTVPALTGTLHVMACSSPANATATPAS